MINLDIWWSSLTVAQKERIATKGNKSETLYPACSTWWNSLSQDKKGKIHDHCVDSHGYFLNDWNDREPIT